MHPTRWEAELEFDWREGLTAASDPDRPLPPAHALFATRRSPFLELAPLSGDWHRPRVLHPKPGDAGRAVNYFGIRSEKA
jgi:hypothetical protein